MRAVWSILIGLGTTACAPATVETPVASAPVSSLAGTSWKLAEIQSMDDAQGTVRPDDPSKYTLTFEADGRLTARFDCNRGMGSWQSENVSALGGSLAIGRLAVTRA